MRITNSNQPRTETNRPAQSSRRSSTGGAFTWTLSGNVAYSLCQWLFVIVLAKMGTAEDVGVYALGLAISSPWLTFANFQGRNLVASDIREVYKFGDYLVFRILSLSLAMVAVASIAALTCRSPAAIAVTCLLAVSQAFDWTSETYFGFMQKHERLDRVGQSLLLKGPLCVMLLSAAMYVTHSLVWATAALAIGRGLVFCFFDCTVANGLGASTKLVLHGETLLRLLRNAFPLGVISAIAAFNFNIPRYFIQSDLSTRDLGIFSAIASLVGAGNLVMSALANTSFVAIARAAASSDRRNYRVLSLRLFGTAGALGVAGVVVSLLAGHDILVRLFRPEYGASTGVFTRLMIAGAIGYIISGQGYALTAARVLLPQIPILLCAAVTTALFCWWLVPLRGIQGASEAWLLSSLVTLSLSSYILSKVHQSEALGVGPGYSQAVSSNAA